MLGKLRIGPKLLLAPGVVLLLLIVLSCGAYYAMVRQNASLETIVRQRAAHIRDASELVVAANHAHTEIYQFLTWYSVNFPAARTEPLVRDIHRRHAAIEHGLAALSNVTELGSAERRFVQQAAAAHGVYVRAVLDVIEISRADQSISANAMLKAQAAFEIEAARLAELSRLEQQLSERATRRAADEFKAMSTLMLVVIGVSVVLSLAITMAVRRSLLAEVREIGNAAVGLGSGNLTVRERDYGSDEISETSRALDTSIRNLNGTLRTILESARSIGSTSREIALGNAHLSTSAGAHASSMEQTANSMEELTATLNRTAHSALVANRLAENASSVAQKGGDVVGRLLTTMASIKGRSGRVVEVVGVIDAIANETNMLALNAAMEAARTGEQGRKVASVVNGVRALAQRSAAAAREIRELVVQAVAEIDGGNAWVLEAGDSIADIAASVQQVGDIVSQISHASAEQASGITEVSQAIVEMDQMTHRNSVLVEEAAAAAGSLQDQALSLSRAVASFHLDEAASVATPVPAGRKGKPGRPNLHLASSR